MAKGPRGAGRCGGVIACLAQITRNRVRMNGAEFDQTSTPTAEQAEILRLLDVSL